MSSQPLLLSSHWNSHGALSLLQRAVNAPVVKCILPPLLLQLIVTLTQRARRGLRPPAAAAAAAAAVASTTDGLLAVRAEALCVEQSEAALSAGTGLHKNFVLTRLNMVAFTNSLRRWLRDHRTDDICLQPEDFPREQRMKHTASSRPPKLAPNHFVAIQITNPEIVSTCVEVQHELIKAGGNRFKPALIKPSKFHLTLMVMHIASDNKRASNSTLVNLDSMTSDDREPASLQGSTATGIAAPSKDDKSLPVATLIRAIEALDACANRLRHLTDANLTVNGVGTFRGQVIFASIDDCAWLRTVIDTVSEEFKRFGIESTDGRPVTPHLTLMKLSQIRGHRSRELKRFDPRKLSDVAETYFGVQKVTSLQLCAMHSPQNLASGYYHIEHEVTLA